MTLQHAGSCYGLGDPTRHTCRELRPVPMQRDFGDYVQQYLSKLMPSDGTPLAVQLWNYSKSFIDGKRAFPGGPVVMEGEYLNAKDASRFARTLCSRMRLFKIVKLWPSTIEIDIFQRLESDDPEALVRIELAMTKSGIIWSRMSYRERNASLIPSFLQTLEAGLH